MTALSVDLGQWLTMVCMGFALGLDAFSLGIGVGLQGIRLLNVLKTSFMVGLFHTIMPLAGMMAGHYLGTRLGNMATLLGGGLLALLGAHMVYSSLTGEPGQYRNNATFWGILLFAFGVSIDSFSVGISFGLLDADIWMTVVIFGFLGGWMSVLGLLIGRHAASWLGKYGEAMGGIILFGFGLRFLL